LRRVPIKRSGQGSQLVLANLHLQDWHFSPTRGLHHKLAILKEQQKHTVHRSWSNFITWQIREIRLNWDAVRLAVASCLAKVSSFFISYINWMANTRHQKKKSVNFLSPIWWPTTKAKSLFSNHSLFHTLFWSGYYGYSWGSWGNRFIADDIWDDAADDLIAGPQSALGKKLCIAIHAILIWIYYIIFISYHIISYLIISYHIISYLTISYHIL